MRFAQFNFVPRMEEIPSLVTLKALCSAARGCRPLSATPGRHYETWQP
jgi:hypothetical protein